MLIYRRPLVPISSNIKVPETLTEDILEKMHAPPKPDLPTISVEELTEPDGIIFGIPTR